MSASTPSSITASRPATTSARDPRQPARRTRPGQRLRRGLRHSRRCQDRVPGRATGDLSSATICRCAPTSRPTCRRRCSTGSAPIATGASARIDAFAYNLVNFSNGVLQDRDNPHANLWGVYGSYDLPKAVLAGARGRKPRSICSISAGARALSPTARGRRLQ